MRHRGSAVLAAVLCVALGAPVAARGQSAGPGAGRPLPPVPFVDGPLAIAVAYPPAGGALTARDSTFLFGSVGSGAARLTIDGAAVPVAPDGAFLAWLPLPDDSLAVFHLAATRGPERDTLDWTVRLPPRFAPPPGAGAAWMDTASLRPRGAVWALPGEPIRVSVRAAPGAHVAVRLPDGRVFPLVLDSVTYVPAGPFERRPERLLPRTRVRFVGVIPAVPLGAPPPPLTAAAADTGAAGPGATVIASLGRDTTVAALPARVALVDPEALPVVVLDADPARTDTMPAAVPGSPTPGGTYDWFFLDGTPAALDGRVGNQGRVRLTATSAAWVSMANVAAVLPPGTPPPATTVRLVRLTPGPASVVARLSLGGRVPFRVDEGERALTVRLYGARSDLEFVQYGGTDPLVRRVIWAQPSTDVCTVTFELSAPVFGWRVSWDGPDLLLEIRRPPAINRAHPLAGMTIAVDPGHPPLGAMGPTGLQEADANLAVGLALRALLIRDGARVVMTRTADTPLGLYPRVRIAERADADILVSIHNNALPDGVNPFVNNGTSTYYFYPRAERLARLTQRALAARLGLADLGIGRADFALARSSWMPAILTEGAFLMIPAQESALRTPAFQRAYARGVEAGIAAYLRSLAPPR